MASPEEFAKVIASLEKRIRFLERTVYRTGRHDEVIFSNPGAVDNSISNPYYVRGPSKIVDVAVTIKHPSTTADSTLTVFLDGVALGTCLVPKTVTYVETDLPDNTNADDGVLTVQMFPVASGLSGVTVSVGVA